MSKLLERLAKFTSENRILNKGAFCVMLVVTDRAKAMKLPIKTDLFRTENRGQVAGLGVASVQAILGRHGIKQVLAKEGGRTSRGSMGNMEKYVAFLNKLAAENLLNLDDIEAFWIQKVKDYFSRAGLVLKYDPSKTLRSAMEDLLAQAAKLQEEDYGTMYVGSLLHYLVGAKLSMCLPDANVEIRGASVADDSSGTAGDYDIGNTAIHVTANPAEAVFQKCAQNISVGFRPMVVTTPNRTAAAQQIAEMNAIADRVEIIDGPQFLAMNLYEKSAFVPTNDKETLKKLVAIYNDAVSTLESDPALLIRFK